MALDKIPFNKDGDMLEYVSTGYYKPKVWKDNIPFKAAMQIVNWERGRSAVRVIVQDESGVKYPMFMKDFFELVTNCDLLRGGVVSDVHWVGVKRGANYGLKIEGL